MNIFKLLKFNILGNVDNDFYIKNKLLLAETNYRMLKTACIFSLFMCIFLYILTFFSDLIRNLSEFYIFFALFFAILTWIVLCFVNKNKNLSTIFYYVFATAILSLAADVSTFKSPDVYAVTFYVFLIIIPMLHVGKPIYAAILSIVSCIVFCLMTFFIKSSVPDIAANDILNAVCCCIVGIGLNITFINLQLENLQSKVHLEYTSSTDELTSLPNRRSLNLYINNIFENKNIKDNIGIIMMDVDNFKSYNDVFGHLEGDECLRQVGKILNDAAAKYSLFIARFGGEEFVGVSVSHDLDALKLICEDIVKEIELLNIINDLSPFGMVTISIGYSDLKSTGAKNYMELINYADDALYLSKINGKNRATFYNSSDYNSSDYNSSDEQK